MLYTVTYANVFLMDCYVRIFPSGFLRQTPCLTAHDRLMLPSADSVDPRISAKLTDTPYTWHGKFIKVLGI